MNREIVKKRLEETPCLEPVDAVKLAYQSEFGCGHLLAPEEECAGRIARELEESVPLERAAPYADIGGDLCRLNLRCPKARSLPPRLMARMMHYTAREPRGSLEGFLERLEDLRALCREGELPFSLAQLEEYLAGYAREGYPPVGHSPRYRGAYGPAYRVVERLYGLALPIVEAVEERLRRMGRALVVLEGDCAGGKTTLAKALAPLWDAPVLSMDDFFLPPSLRTPERLGTPGGNVAYERFREEALEGLLAQAKEGPPRPFVYRAFDCHAGTSSPREVSPSPVVIIEGSYSHHPAFEEAYRKLNALRVFLFVEAKEQLRRLEARNPALLPRFRREWIPLEKAYFQAYDIPGRADIALCTQEGWK